MKLWWDKFSVCDEWKKLWWIYQVVRKNASLQNLIYIQETSVTHDSVMHCAVCHGEHLHLLRAVQQ